MTNEQRLQAELFRAKTIIVGLRQALANTEAKLGEYMLDRERVALEGDFLKEEPSGSLFDWSVLSVKPPAE